MKFGRLYRETLRNEGYPPDWVDSAISYAQLKKCIARLTSELAQLGLDPATLSTLLKHVEHYNASAGDDDDQDRPFEYILAGDVSPTQPSGPRKPFHPKLLFYVDETTGEAHAKLHSETRSKLHMLAVATGVSQLRVSEEPDRQSLASQDSADLPGAPDPATGATSRPRFRTVEIPLTSDSEFFARLTSQLSGLEHLQEREEKKMHAEIEELGKQVAVLTDPEKKANRKSIQAWRQVFQLYLESGIFFGTTERDHAAHNADQATQRFLNFSDKLAKAGLVEKFKKPEEIRALSAFVQINRKILQGLRYGDLNHVALSKILKKFDKRTALGVKTTFPATVSFPEFSENLAKVVCASVTTDVINHLPLLDDYSCPMCMEIKWRPVRLRCNHVFCIRCLIVMQTNKQHKCPLCREETVGEANSDNLDLQLAEFLKKWFPDEVKAKQKQNVIQAGVDEYGECYVEGPFSSCRTQ